MTLPDEKEVVAWGDESIRFSETISAYLLAATILPEDCDLSRLVHLKSKDALKLHWRDLTEKVKSRALHEIASLDCKTVLAIASPLSKKKQERGRRKCMELVLPELEKMGVSSLVLESRVLQLNDKDVDMLQAMRRKKQVSSLALRHAHASNEPRLWVADQILGAYGDWLCGKEMGKWEESWADILPTIVVKKASA